MQLSYAELEGAAASLRAVANRLYAERPLSGDLGAGASAADEAYRATASTRQRYVRQLGELAAAQSRAASETVRLFVLLDAQIAMQLTDRTTQAPAKSSTGTRLRKGT